MNKTKTRPKSNRSAAKGPMTSQLEQSSNRWFIATIAAIVVVGSIAVAILANNRDAVRAADQTAPVTLSDVQITPLPEGVTSTDPSSDPEAGTVAPTLSGTDFDGNEITIAPDGRPKAIYFLAHWCSHCQAEVPEIQELIDGGRLPEGLDVYAVSTAVDPTQANFSPQLWLEREGFSPQTVRDDSNSSALMAFGGSGFPYAVYLDTDYQIAYRTAGEQGKDAISAIWDALALASQ